MDKSMNQSASQSVGRSVGRRAGSAARLALATIAVGAAVAGALIATGDGAQSAGGSADGSANGPANQHVACDRIWFHGHTVADEDRCRDNGWKVRPLYVISATGDRMWTGVGPCPTEDSRRCYWNARRRGNHRGHSFVQLGRLGTFYGLVEINGRKA
jgi:hypothetical protein